ncbi:23S rRNA (guanosine(2251)-2'-O)-methyltransferase RlmB [Crocinitomicaceae bacterium]|jgi:23S rRNA (guanosine2251-2'-O)-methyltransferase|nr:23S rRNA (guanosine(2251)-2'-O)-methyltransferase RlmB [Crocinitomicaceae bacterium]
MEQRKEQYQRKEKKDIIFGIHPVIEAIKSEQELNKIMIQRGIDKEHFRELKDVLADKDYYIQYVPIQKLNTLTSGNHQGVVAFVTPIAYQNIETLVDKWVEEEKKPCILALDRITDVRNFGAIARSAECQGVDAILIPSKGSALVTADAVRTSSGALSRIPVCKTEDLKNSLFYIQQSGYRIVACTEKSSMPLQEVNLRGAMAIVMGSEENGITSDLINMADLRTNIPMLGNIASLNVGVATGIILYEKMRQELNR